jgi:hypothetical protein
MQIINSDISTIRRVCFRDLRFLGRALIRRVDKLFFESTKTAEECRGWRNMTLDVWNFLRPVEGIPV